jgi:hypothetical protein
MLPLTILTRMATRACQGALLGLLALGGLAMAANVSPEIDAHGLGPALVVAYFAATSTLAAARWHVPFRAFYLGAAGLPLLALWGSWQLTDAGYAGLPWTLGVAIALVTAGVLFGKAAYDWAVEKAPTRW